MAIDRVASQGFSAGAGAYERARPAYPAEAVDRLLAGVPPSPRVLDLGAGTGKLTALLAERCDDVFALEPVGEMRARLASALRSVRVAAGTAEAIPFADASFDAVFVAQAFHWFEAERALAELRRVVRPGGRLGLVWNVRDRSVRWVDEMAAIVDEYGDAIRRHESGDWRGAFDEPTGFSPLERTEFRNVQLVDAGQVLDRVASTSFIASLPHDERAKVLGRVSEVLRADPETKEKDRFAFPHLTGVYCCRRV